LTINDERYSVDEDTRIAFMVADKIAIIGMPLAGKSTIIRSTGGVDLDAVVELRTERRIPDLLADGVFRAEESAALRQLVEERTPLLALGGGAILKQENVDLLADYFVVFLDTPLEVLHERLKTSARPLIKEPTDLDRLFVERYPLYSAVADVKLDGATLEQLLEAKMTG